MSCSHVWRAAVAVVVLASPAAAQDRLLVYGFYDTELEATNRDPDNFAITFDQHHFNVITVYRLSDRWRVFGEIEWEHGVELEAGSGTGLVALERGWAEYAAQDEFKVRFGKFVLPFGIYNLVHDATPTYLSSFLPNAIYGKHATTTGGSARMYAKFGTGVQVLGTAFARDWRMDYFAYLTNGRGPQPHKNDNNQNKGVGARLAAWSPSESFRAGLSYYEDRNGLANDTKQRVVAADIGAGVGRLWIEAEGFLPSLERVDGLGIPNGDFRSGRGYYVQGSYRTDAGVTPFARYDFFDPDGDAANDADSDVVLGLNVQLTDFAFLKGEIQFLRFRDPATDSYEKFVASIAIAF